METFRTLNALKKALVQIRRRGETIALVPTMGYLHEGHLQLVRTARQSADRVIVSLYVNPFQFAPSEDFSSYPRTPEADAEALRRENVDGLFLPATEELYPRPPEAMTFVEVPGLSDTLCGAFRAGHFRGVATVVLKLFHLIQPDTAVFGEKDLQQLVLIRRLVEDLHLPIQIVGVPTVREADGLAKSSRNSYLSAIERPLAGALFAALNEAASALGRGPSAWGEIAFKGQQVLEAKGFEVDYFAIRRLDDLEIPGPLERRLVILVAARLGRTRLIDNLSVDEALG